jgi:hypothetical protein
MAAQLASLASNASDFSNTSTISNTSKHFLGFLSLPGFLEGADR